MPRTKEQFLEIREKTRENILNAALKLFATKGYHGTSISDIAETAGISKGLAYNYFDSKQEIVEAIFLRLLEIGEKFEKETDLVKDPYENLRKVIITTFDYYEENEEFMRLYILFALQPGILEEAQRISARFRKRYTRKLENLFKTLGFADPKLEIRYLDAVLDGIGLNYITQKNDYPFKKMRAYVLKRYSKEQIKKMVKF